MIWEVRDVVVVDEAAAAAGLGFDSSDVWRMGTIGSGTRVCEARGSLCGVAVAIRLLGNGTELDVDATLELEVEAFKARPCTVGCGGLSTRLGPSAPRVLPVPPVTVIDTSADWKLG